MNNVNNILVSKLDLEKFINKYTQIYDPKCIVKINDINLLRRTLVHKSFNNYTDCEDETDIYCNIDFSRKLTGNNERLEFLGDRVIDLIVAEYLFDLYPQEQEGFLSDTKTKIVKKESLNYIGSSVGLPQYMLISNMMERTGERSTNINLPENIFESFVGGLFKDQNSNFYICRAFVIGVLKTFVDLDTLVKTTTNFKTLVNKEFHKNHWEGNPIYKLTKNIGDITGRHFNSVLCVLKTSIKDEDTYNLFAVNDRNMRETIRRYEGKDVENIYFVLTTNVEPCSTKKKAEQKCSEIFMQEFTNELNV